MDREMIFHTGNKFPKLGLVVTEGARELGEKIDQYLISWAEDSPEATESFLIDCECPRFSSGDTILRFWKSTWECFISAGIIHVLSTGAIP